MKLQSLVTLALTGSAHAIPHSSTGHTVNRQAAELRDAYDFASVLAVEYDDIEYAARQFEPPKLVRGETGGYASRWELTSTPSPKLGNATAYVIAGRVVGASSAVKQDGLDRGSRHDYDAWQQLQAGCDTTTPKFTDPVPAGIFNTTFAAAALAGFNVTPATGHTRSACPTASSSPPSQT
ncbi:hypothetical protein MFIFM68171_01978 [Madurella fahalii]|uniref:Uncharacterized protein n=1 Tax=Madurella fahalii TaxID=1157608 RepID=A0ABQ0G1Y7_9PEZI